MLNFSWVPGHHNALNAAAAFAAAVELGVEPAQAAAALASYRGAARRLEPKGEAGGVRVLDTYAHHPTELAADLRAAREIDPRPGGGRVIAVFQPHLYSRTRIFAAGFGAALGLADEAVVLDVYAAREDPEPGVTGQLVADAVPGGAAHYVPEFADVPKIVAALAGPGDLVLTMGAGTSPGWGRCCWPRSAARPPGRAGRAAAGRGPADRGTKPPAAPRASRPGGPVPGSPGRRGSGAWRPRGAGRRRGPRRRRGGGVRAGALPSSPSPGWRSWPGWAGPCSATGCSSCVGQRHRPTWSRRRR